ncbi:DUF2283 domain-containing protein [Crocosphaera sp.]|uniref:DUF2283 domain-containing protein n=1 Tax=Crocosphaera sp. TaxID=2729996 RepID=UPI003F2109C1|nr:DUF2283 domain-containing protein [Crocosphaera sp.]
MATKTTIYYDKEGDFLEVLFSDQAGYMRETNNDAIMEKVDDKGNLLGFSILGISQLIQNTPLNLDHFQNPIQFDINKTITTE